MSVQAPIDTLGDARDALADVRYLIQCVWMASGMLDDSDALQVVLDCANERVERVEAALNALIEDGATKDKGTTVSLAKKKG